MKPRPLLRRVSFWLGLFVACFLAWAWWDSWQYVSMVGFGGRGVRIALGSVSGQYGFSCHMSGPADFDRVAIREPREGILGTIVLGDDFGGIPHSLVFFSFVGLWVGWLALSDWRRKTRVGRVEKLP